MAEKNRKVALTVNVRLEHAPGVNEFPEIAVYAYDATGEFLASAPLPKGDQVQTKLELPARAQAGGTLRLMVGSPQHEDESEVPLWMDKLIQAAEPRPKWPLLPRLARQGAYEKRMKLLTDEPTVVDILVRAPDWTAWLLCPCVIRGRLVKRVSLPDGTKKDFGVCHACVKIYEVDKFYKFVYELPDYEILKLRDDILDMLRELEREPFPWPPNPPGPPVKRVALSTGVESTVAGMSSEFLAMARANTTTQLREAMVAGASAILPYLCHFPWTWYRLHKDLIRCCCTDEQGRFATTYLYKCTGDKPDLYFQAVQCIGGSLHTLYDPGVACHTHWNYVCGTEVLLLTTDPAAITCAPQDPVQPPAGVGLWVMPYAVGGVRLDQISPEGFTDYAAPADAVWTDVPFGGTLGFRHGYSSAIPLAAAGKPAYYRWRYNKLTAGGAETDWREFAPPVASTVVRHMVDYDLAHPELPPTYPVYPLGPQNILSMHLYEFKPHTLVQPPGHKREWPVDDWFADIYSGILQTTLLPGGALAAAGKYRVMLQVYDKDGTLLAPGAATFEFIVPTGLAADGTTILTRKALPGEIEDSGFVFHVHVDNNACEAAIYETQVNGSPAGTCGFIGYAAGDDAHLSFLAKHPNGFGRFQFTVVKGSTGYVNAACAPGPPAASMAVAPQVTDTPVNGFVRDATTGVHAKDVDEAVIRGGCPKAAFGENLYVAATAIDGWSRLSYLDAYAVPMAFALEPKAP